MEQNKNRTRRQNRRVPCDWETPEREKSYNGRESSESFSDFESPLNSLRSPLRLESKRAYSEGKHKDRNLQLRCRLGNTTLLKQKPVFSSDENAELGKIGDCRMDRHSSGSKDHAELTEPRTVSGATDWASIVEEEERNEVHEKSFRKRLELGQQQKRQRTQTKGHSASETEGEAEGGLDEVEHPSSFETDPKVLERRHKQLSYGIKTSEYQNYRKQVPLHKRTKFHPWTPDKRLKYSRRGWDTVIRIWRRQLHIWDPNPKLTDIKLCSSLPLDKTEPTNHKDPSEGQEQEPLLDAGDLTTENVDQVAVDELPESDSEYLDLDSCELDAGD